MTTDSLRMRPPIISYIGYAGRGTGPARSILAVAGVSPFVLNYWFGSRFFIFWVLLAWILFGFKGFQGRNLLLLLYVLASCCGN